MEVSDKLYETEIYLTYLKLYIHRNGVIKFINCKKVANDL